MIVNQIHIHDFAVIKSKHYPPVTRNADAPLARTVTLQGMQPETRRVGVTRMRRLLQTK